MLNKRPIFINGFSRSGSTILNNFLASHPEVSTVAEIHHLFKGQTYSESAFRLLFKCVLHDGPILLSQRQDFFSPRLHELRKPVSPGVQRFIDRIIFKEKQRMRSPLANQYKYPGVEYTNEELAASRVVGKNLDGLIYATDVFAEMYPDATFVGLVRNGLAVCEGQLRRGHAAEDIGRRYRCVVEKMLSDAERIPRYQLFRFEDLIHATDECVGSLYRHCDLDMRKLQAVRMQVRRAMDSHGNHRLTGDKEWDVVWYDLDRLDTYFHQDVNQNQIRRLADVDRKAFLREAGPAMEQLGYPIEPSESAPPVVYSFLDRMQQGGQLAHSGTYRKAA
ncbi:MAG: sulfotransferase [Pirellulales bacterium]